MRSVVKKYRALSEKTKQIISNITGAFILKGASIIVSLLTMPAYIRYFENQKILGIWFTLLSVFTWILNFDLGIGNGLRNHLTKSITEKDNEKSKKYISSAYITIGLFVVLLILVFIFSARCVNWNRVFNIREADIARKDLNIAVTIIFVGIMLQFFFRLISSILYALQMSAMNSVLNLSTSILILGYLMLYHPSSSEGENLILVAIVHALAVIIPLIMVTVILFCTKLKEARPSVKWFDKKCARQVFSLGVVFFVVQIEYMIIMNTNEFLITQFSGSEYVVEYQIYYKLFTLPGILINLALSPIWSMITKAVTQNDFKWIRKLYNKMSFISFVGIIGEFVMVIFASVIVELWLRENSIRINYAYATVFATVGSCMILNAVFSSIANGMNKLKNQAIFFGVGAILNVPLAYVMSVICNSWIGVPIANIVSLGIYCIVESITITRYINGKSKESENSLM